MSDFFEIEFEGVRFTVKDASAVESVTLSGKIVTVKKRDGTSTTFDVSYDEATTSKAGLMSAADKTKLNGIEAQANKYVHPSYTARTKDLYKVAVDATGHVTDVTVVGNATALLDGLMSATDKAHFDFMYERFIDLYNTGCMPLLDTEGNEILDTLGERILTPLIDREGGNSNETQ